MSLEGTKMGKSCPFLAIKHPVEVLGLSKGHVCVSKLLSKQIVCMCVQTSFTAGASDMLQGISGQSQQIMFIHVRPTSYGGREA